jgi:S1-C subfamily serine protease
MNPINPATFISEGVTMRSTDDLPSARVPLIAYAWPLLLLIGAFILLIGWFWRERETGLNPEAESRPIAARADLTAEEKTNIAIYERAAPAVVHVTNVAEQSGLFNLDLLRIPKGTGSGFVWDQAGHIVTNYHVVEGADAVRVILADGSTYDARQVWSYPDKDIAVVWIDAPKSKLHPVLIGTSHNLKVGQVSYAIGNPFGLDQTMTTGIVSALGREIGSASGHPIHGAIQTSAPINPGNSGGPLLDSAGRLIGMTTMIVSPSGASAGIGFAIPVDEINEIVPQLIRHGKVVRPQLGVQIAEDQLAQQLGIDQGALIVKVVPDGPAAQAGLQGTRRDPSGRIQVGDVIVAIDGKAINHGKDLSSAFEHYHAGDTLTVTILRSEQRQDVKVTLRALN